MNDIGSDFRDDHVRIHFHLRNEIMIGKKKANNVQFISQVRKNLLTLCCRQTCWLLPGQAFARIRRPVYGLLTVRVFVAQVGEDNIKLSDVRRSAYDPDELEDEQRERDRRNKMNKLYKKFAIQIQDEAQKTAHSLELDIPYKDLCFTGRASLKGARCDSHLQMPEGVFVSFFSCLPAFFSIKLSPSFLAPI